MSERFSGVGVLFNADAYAQSLEIAPRNEWVVLSKDWIVWTGQDIAKAASQQPDPFIRGLGIVLGAMAQRYTEMAEEEVDNVIEFGLDIIEQTGISSCSPIEYVLAILTNSPLGKCIIERYRQMADKHNDPTGQRLLDHLLAMHVDSYQ